MTDYEKTWLRGAEGEMLTLTVYVPRAECIETWQFFNETVLEFLAHRQIPYEINMTDHYGERKREPKPNLHVNPKAPEWLKDMLREVFPTGNEVSAGEMERKLDAQRELRDLSDRDLAEVFEAALRSDDAEGVQVLGTELLRRFDGIGAGDSKQ